MELRIEIKRTRQWIRRLRRVVLHLRVLTTVKFQGCGI